MGKALFGGIGIVLLVYAFFDLLATPSDRVRYLPKPLWFLAVLVPFVGPLLWLFFGAARGAGPSTPPAQRTGGGWHPPPPPKGPDDDPDYLRGL